MTYYTGKCLIISDPDERKKKDWPGVLKYYDATFGGRMRRYLSSSNFTKN